MKKARTPMMAIRRPPARPGAPPAASTV